MLKSDYDILVNVYHLLLNSEPSDDEVSFLLGKPDVYFFDILNPSEKTKLKSDLLPLFVPIFQKGIASILPDKFYPDEEVRIFATSKFNKKSTVYKHTVAYKDGSVSDEIVWSKKVVRGIRNKENAALTIYLEELIAAKYFVKPRTALHLLIHLRKNFTGDFTATDIKVSLAKLCRSQNDVRPELQRNLDNACYTYSENYYIELTKQVKVLKELVLSDANDLQITDSEKVELTEALSYYTISGLDKVVLGFIALDGKNLKAIYILKEYRHIRLGSRLIDCVVKLDNENPLMAEVPVESSVLEFLDTCNLKESKEVRAYRKKNKLKVKRLERKK